MAKYNIGGYIFDDENKAKKAAKELKQVEYILAQIKDLDENGVLTVYKKLLKQRLFSTEIGMSFLSQLRQNLVGSGVFTEEEVPEVYTIEQSEPSKPTQVPKEEKTSTEEVTPKEKPDKKPKAKKEKADKSIVSSSDQAIIKRLKLINRILLVLCITLLLCVIGMFFVNSTINSPTILDYEDKILDEYSSWEQELSQREQDLNEREKALTEKELQRQ
ncbi:hypothetical protein SAMN04487830_11728 [Pseudobutyrivibrio sp. OR37]|uniref:hypothetical protein n=1 Tax=Pseudobutyrivibrio sp. OR37 TaxID=1798186 RepID=UPI0008E37D16|nr:hypothetical protein [Pseudobutyrivibrio sp. OR37]SFI00327.1 hypothetical protein SAMN04487830_11728 [Pseudobutyrivibrio sp. OR37]